MTLTEFVATRQWSDDLGADLEDARWEGELPAKGWIYADWLYIEQVQDHWPDAVRQRGKWSLLIGNTEQIDDLSVLEPILYEWAMAEGYVEADFGKAEEA